MTAFGARPDGSVPPEPPFPAGTEVTIDNQGHTAKADGKGNLIPSGAGSSGPPNAGSSINSASKWVYPFQGSFPITEPFGPDPGVDWGMPQGTAVDAIGNGTVTAIGLPGYGGQAVQIDHGNGIVSYYGHLTKALVSIGQQVSMGQQIGLSGGTPGDPNAGISTGAHLELGVIVNGQHVDPIKFLQSQGASAPSGLQINPAFSLNPFDWVGKIFKPLIEFLIEAGMVIGGGVLMFFGLALIAKSTGHGKGIVTTAAAVGLRAVK